MPPRPISMACWSAWRAFEVEFVSAALGELEQLLALHKIQLCRQGCFEVFLKELTMPAALRHECM